MERAIGRRHRKAVYRWLDVKPGETRDEAERRIYAEAPKGAVVHLLSWLDPAEARCG